jgi:3-oxoacyl-(acyl-carrier-protein) synthase
MRRHDRRVVVTGVGPVAPIGLGREEFWSAAASGVSGTSALSELPLSFPIESLRSRVVGRVKLATNNTEPRHIGLARAAMRLALQDAGLESLDHLSSSLVMGTAVAATAEMEKAYLGLWDRERRDQQIGDTPLLPMVVFQTMADVLAAESSCHGAVLTVSTGCTAGIDAIGMSFDLVRSGRADVVLTGASEAPLTPVVFAAFDAIGALTQRNERPQAASRPFDAGRDGFVLGEGAACLVLEERGHAMRRGAPIYAEIEGFASLCNGYHMTDLPADGAAMACCMEAALQDADLAAGEIDYINAHGSSTLQNDLCETNAVKRVLGAQAYDVAVTSLKSMTGHALGASNALEIANCALSLQRQFLCPTINFERAGEGCDLDYVPNSGRSARLKHLFKLSSGFSGIHSVLVMARP